jgi:murein L,D-transpeptidase YafK
MRRAFKYGLILTGVSLLCFWAALNYAPKVSDSTRLGSGASDISTIRAYQKPQLTRDLQAQGLRYGAPVFLRIFKEEATLELWMQDGEQFRLFRSYPICNHSGDLGPKLKEGDRQSPEGIYTVSRQALNPNSRFHLSFNLGFPNRYDQSLGRTGSFLMVHGDCVSIGCYAMTDPMIEEIYVLVEAALDAGQSAVSVHAFPFRMTQTRMQAAGDHRWFGFWQELKPIYDAFELNQKVPKVVVQNQAYRLNGSLIYRSP